jgi:hypothetical protein
MKNISTQYQDLKEGKIDRHQFLRNARMMFPNFVTNHNSFEDSVKILKNKGLLNEGDAVKGTPDKAPSYDYPTQPSKYKKVIQEPEVDEQDGIYPATTLTDIPKEDVSKPIKSKNRPDGLEPIKNNDKKNEMKKVRLVRESKKKLTESQVTPKQIQDKYNEMFGKNPQTTFADVAKALGISEQEIDMALLFKGNMPGLREDEKKKDKYDLSTSPGTQVPMGAKTQSKIDDFLSQFRSPGASGPGQSLNKLKDKIKEIVREIVDEIGPAGIEAAGNPEDEAEMKAALIKKEAKNKYFQHEKELNDVDFKINGDDYVLDIVVDFDVDSTEDEYEDGRMFYQGGIEITDHNVAKIKSVYKYIPGTDDLEEITLPGEIEMIKTKLNNELSDKVYDKLEDSIDWSKFGGERDDFDLDENEEIENNEETSEDAFPLMNSIDYIVKYLIKSKASNDLGLKFKRDDVEDVFYNFQERANRQFSDKQHQRIIDSAIEKLKKHGFNIELT